MRQVVTYFFWQVMLWRRSISGLIFRSGDFLFEMCLRNSFLNFGKGSLPIAFCFWLCSWVGVNEIRND